MNRTIYFKREESRANRKHLGIVLLVLLFLFADSLAFGQSAESVPVGSASAGVASSVANEQYLTIISVAVAILAALTTIAILIPTILAFVQIRRVEKEWERFTKMADAAEQQTITLRESVREFRPPAEILKEAADKAEKITDSEVGILRSRITELEGYLKERLSKLEASSEKEKTSLDQLTTAVNSVKLELDKKPSTSDILVKVTEKYKIPDDLMEIVLQKVGLALSCLRNLTEEERKEIRKELSVNPRRVEGKEE